MVWPWSLSPLPPRPNLAHVQGASGRLSETITNRPDAKTGNRSRPCRELSRQRTLNHPHSRSRFGECCIVAGAEPNVSFRRRFASAKLISASSTLRWQVQRRRLSFAAIRPGAAGSQEKCRSSPSRFQVHREETMSIFGKIMSAIFGTKADAAPAGGGASASTGSASGSASAAPAQSVDVAPILDKAVAAKGEKLEWRTSIVDLMKALDIDSSFGARKELAKELGYTGDSNDSASMNIWLHKQGMVKLAANGGKLPPDIKH